MVKRLPEQKIERCVDCKHIACSKHGFYCNHPEFNGDSSKSNWTRFIDDESIIHECCPLDDYNLPMKKPVVDPTPYLRRFVAENEVRNADEMVKVDMSEAWDVVMYLLLACGFGDLVPDGYKNSK